MNIPRPLPSMRWIWDLFSYLLFQSPHEQTPSLLQTSASQHSACCALGEPNLVWQHLPGTYFPSPLLSRVLSLLCHSSLLKLSGEPWKESSHFYHSCFSFKQIVLNHLIIQIQWNIVTIFKDRKFILNIEMNQN